MDFRNQVQHWEKENNSRKINQNNIMQDVMNVVAKVVMYVMAVGNVQWKTLAYAINVTWDGN